MANETIAQRDLELFEAQQGAAMWKAELLRVMARLHKLAGTPSDSGYETALEKLESAGRSLEQERWISVEERLPEEEQIVLAWFVDDNSAIGGDRREGAQVWEYSQDHPYFPRRSGARQGVTHWQLMPAPPVHKGDS